jgi:hypothetical protein
VDELRQVQAEVREVLGSLRQAKKRRFDLQLGALNHLADGVERVGKLIGISTLDPLPVGVAAGFNLDLAH